MRKILFIFPLLLLLAPAFALADGSQSYSTPGTYSFTVPSYATLAVTVNGAGGGGGSGAYLFWQGNPGSNGAASSFNGAVFGNGGGGGGAGTFSGAGAAGAAGGASGGDTKTSGGAPGGGGSGNGGYGGYGGSAVKSYGSGALTPGTSIAITVGGGGAGGVAATGGTPGASGGNGSVTITWTAPTVPPTCTLSPSSQTIAYGSSAALNYTISGSASSATINGVSVSTASSGTYTPSPNVSTNYTMTVGNASGSNTCGPVSVTVTSVPTVPSISGPTSGSFGVPYSYSFIATDSGGNNVRYGIDWDGNGTVDQWLPASGYAASGASQTTNHSWSTAGTYTFEALTQNLNGTNSGWTSYTVTIGSSGSSGATEVIFLTSGTSWTVPSDWNSSNNTIEVIGGGGGGAGVFSTSVGGGGGGGGGGYSKVTNLSLTPGASIAYQVGTGGGGGLYGRFGGSAGTAGTDTFFNGSGCTTSSLCARGGGGGSGTPSGGGGAGGAAGSGAGSTQYSGGSGGAVDWNTGTGAGGGAGGQHGGGGSGATLQGGTGGAGFGGAGGGNGATGGSGSEWGAAGSGGGGGGGGVSIRNGQNLVGQPGGTYGGGGGATYEGYTGTASTPGGSGTSGIIVITYTPTSGSPTLSCSVWFDQSPLPYGSSTTIHWTSAAANSLYINSIGYVAASGSTTVAPLAATDYSCTATGSSSSGGSQTYTSPGTYSFTATSSYSSLTAKVWGAGGGGSGCRGIYNGTSGTSGGDSSFGSVVAYGGMGGVLCGGGSTGGAAINGDVMQSGGSGSIPACTSSTEPGGTGGSSQAASGGYGGTMMSFYPAPGGAGGAPGAGGGGAAGTGAGGGAGGYASKTYNGGTLSGTVTITVGSGGGGGNSCSNGYGTSQGYGGSGASGEVFISWTGGTGATSIYQAILPVTPPPSPTAAISASSTSIYVGQSTNILATFAPGSGDVLTHDNIDSPEGTGLGATTNPDASKTITFTPSTAGTYIFYARAQTQYYTSWTSYASTTVSVTASPSCSTFSLNPASITKGNSSTLTWSCQNSSSCTGTNFSTGGATNGFVTVSPSQSTTYSVTCQSPSGQTFMDVASSTLTVACPPSTVYTCSPQNVIQTVTNSSCQQTVTNPYASCSSPAFCSQGSATCLYPPPQAQSQAGRSGHLEVSPTLVSSGSTAKVYWNITNVSSCTVRGTNGDGAGSPPWNGPSSGTGGKTTSAITASVTYTLTCTGLDNSTYTETTSVGPAPRFNEL